MENHLKYRILVNNSSKNVLFLPFFFLCKIYRNESYSLKYILLFQLKVFKQKIVRSLSGFDQPLSL